jgi:hypothetical protein
MMTGSTEYRGAAVAGIFLTRVTQESRSPTERNSGPARDHHAGIMAEKSAESLQCSILWNINTDILITSHKSNGDITIGYRAYPYSDRFCSMTRNISM